MIPINDNAVIGSASGIAPKPTDKWRLVQIAFFLHGISALLPWNMLINADSYFVDYKLNPNVALGQNRPTLTINCLYANQSDCLNNSTVTSLVKDTYFFNKTFAQSPALANYGKNFLPYLSTASKLPNIIFQLVNLLFSSSYIASSNRIVFSFIVEIGLFVITIILAFIDTSSWPELFFWVTIVIAVLFNTVNGIFQSCIYGIGAKFQDMRYINYITLGFSFSGTIASIFLIISLLLSPHPKIVAIFYFSFATLFMIACLINEYLIRNNDFLKYNVLLNETNIEQHSLDSKNGNSITSFENPFSVSECDLVNSTNKVDDCTVTFEDDKSVKKTYLFIFRKSWVQLLNIVLIYFVSFSIFPAIQAGIKPLNSIVPDKFFAPIFCFLFFNTWATVGNYVAERILLPAPKSLIYLVLLRSLFIPFFLMCNYLPSLRIWPVYFGNDWIYVFGSAFMAFTSGYLSALGMMYVPRCVPLRYASKSSMMASASVIIGILAGVQFSIVLRYLVTSG